MHPLVMRLLAAAGSAGVNTLTFLASATSATATITIPAGAQAGDLAVMIDWAFNSSQPTTVVPTGWTSIRNDAGTLIRHLATAKILVGGDAGSTITGMTGSVGTIKTMLVFRGDKSVSSFVAGSDSGEITGGNPSAQTVTVTGVQSPVLAIGCYTSTGALTGASMSPSEDGTVSNTISGTTYQQMRYRAGNAADVTTDLGDGGTANGLLSFYLRVS